MPTVLQAVQAYCPESLAHLQNSLTYGSLASTEFNEWESYVPGLRGDTVLYRLPTLFNVSDSISFNPLDGGGDFQERFGTLTINTEKLVRQNITNEQWQTTPLDKLMDDFGSDMAASLAGKIDEDLAKTACLSGYRWAGDINARAGSLGDYQSLRLALTQYRNFGGTKMAQCVLPDLDTTLILNTGLQEFTPVTNDKTATNWQIGGIKGGLNAVFYQSSMNPEHISGTLSEAGNGEFLIESIESSQYIAPGTTTILAASTITLTGVPNGVTVVVNDIGDIGTATQPGGKFNGLDPIKFLRLQDKTKTFINPQFNVVEGATSSGGTLQFKVIPELVFDATNQNTSRNLSRLVNVGGGGTSDRLRIVKSHRAGTIWQDKAFRFAAPKLPNLEPFPCGVHVDKETKIGYRVYQAPIIGNGTTVFIHDLRYGKRMEPEYQMRLIFPLNAEF
jgi:hypothetical protein